MSIFQGSSALLCLVQLCFLIQSGAAQLTYGHFHSAGTLNITGQFHVWVKCRYSVDNYVNKMSIRGFFFVEPDDLSQQVPNLPIKQRIPKNWRPKVYFSIDGTRHYFQIFDTWQLESPVSFELNMDGSIQNGKVHKVGFEQFDWEMDLSMSRCQQKAQVPANVPPKIVVVFAYVFNPERPLTQAAIASHMRYHLCLGASKYLIYYDGETAKQLLQHPELNRYHRRGILLFSQINKQFDLGALDNFPYAWQSVYYNHAILSFWNTAARLLIADVDEYFALKPGSNLNTFFLEHKQDIIHMPRSSMATDNVSAMQEVLKTDFNKALMMHKARLAEYSDPKATVLPEKVFSFHVHSGACIGKAITLDDDSALILHYTELFKARLNFDKEQLVHKDGEAWLAPECLLNPGEEKPADASTSFAHSTKNSDKESL